VPPLAATSEWMIGCEASTGAGEKNYELGALIPRACVKLSSVHVWGSQ
jgi:hypothetical protein